MRALLAVTGVVVGLASSARADIQPEPAAPAFAAEPKIGVGVAATIWFPAGDIDQAATTSLGIRPQVTYRVHPAVTLLGTFDWIFVDEKSGSAAGDVTYWAISAGARASKRLANRLEPYGELLAGYHTLKATGVDDSAIGFRIGGGVMYPLGGSVIANAGLSFSTVSIDAGFFDVQVDAAVIDLGLVARF